MAGGGVVAEVGTAGAESVLFVPIVKVDAARREILGVAAEEQKDKSGEKFDYATSVPHFKSWSDEFAKATRGRSRGNVREMHTPSAVGKLVDLGYDDAKKQILFRAKVVDDGAWKKVEEGVYTGVSIGGKYLKRWSDPSEPDVTRYTARPAELSLVDNPCMYGARFEMLKADGVVEQREFHKATEGAMAMDGDAEPLFKVEARNGCFTVTGPNANGAIFLSEEKAHLFAKGRMEMLAKVVRQEGDKWAVYSESGDKKLGEHATAHDAYAQLAAIEHSKKAAMGKTARTDNPNPDEGTQQYGDVAFADEENKKYPIDTAAHVRSAWNYINKPANAAKYKDGGTAVKRKIIAAWKSKLDSAGPPSAQKMLLKGYYEVSDLAGILGALDSLLDRIDDEQTEEGDEKSPAVAALHAACQALGDALVALTREEVDEEQNDDGAAGPGGSPVAKIGARNSSADLARINQMHHLAVQLGADCQGAAPTVTKQEGEPMTEQDKEDMKKMLTETVEATVTAALAKRDAAAAAAAPAPAPAAAPAPEASGETDLQKMEKTVAPIAESLKKLASETTAAIEKMATDTKATLDDLSTRLAKVESGPGPSKGVLAGGRPAVAKGQDTGGDAETAADRLSKIAAGDISDSGRRDVFAGAIKELHAKGGVPFTPGYAG